MQVERQKREQTSSLSASTSDVASKSVLATTSEDEEIDSLARELARLEGRSSADDATLELARLAHGFSSCERI